MKKIKWIAVAFVAAVVIVVVVVFININSIVRSAVETQSTASLGLETKVGGASVSLLGGSVKLSDYSVASPSGFPSPHFLEVGSFGVQAGISELRQEPVRVGQIVISKPKLIIEQAGLKLNLQAVTDQMPKSAPSGKEATKVIVGEIRVEDSVIVIRPGIPGLSEEVTVNVPTITLKEVGTGAGNQNGVAIKEVVMKVATAMASEAAKSEKLPPAVRLLLEGNIAGIKAQIGEALQKQLDDATKKLGDKAGDLGGKAGEEAKKALDKVFKK